MLEICWNCNNEYLNRHMNGWYLVIARKDAGGDLEHILVFSLRMLLALTVAAGGFLLGLMMTRSMTPGGLHTISYWVGIIGLVFVVGFSTARNLKTMWTWSRR